MTKDEKIKYLETILSLNNSIIRDIDEIARIRNNVGSYTRHYRSKNTNSAGVISKTEISEKCISSKQKSVNEKIDLLVSRRLAIEEKVSELCDRRMSLLLKYRYIDGLEWKEICKKLYISDMSSRVYILHDKALEKLDI